MQSKRTTKASKARSGDQPFTLAAFPHPALGVATLRWTPVGTSAVGTIRVTDLQGRQVWEGSTAEGATPPARPFTCCADAVTKVPQRAFVLPQRTRTVGTVGGAHSWIIHYCAPCTIPVTF